MRGHMRQIWIVGLCALLLSTAARASTVVAERSFSQNLGLSFDAGFSGFNQSRQTFELPDLLPAPTFGPELLRIDISGSVSLHRSITLDALGLLPNSVLTGASASFAAFDLDPIDVDPPEPIEIPLLGSIAASHTFAMEGFSCNFGIAPRPPCPRTRSFDESFTFAFSFPAPFIDLHERIGILFEPLQGLRMVFGIDYDAACGVSGPCEGGTLSGVWEGAVRVAYVFEDAESVPEPTTLALFGAGLLGLAARRRVKREDVTRRNARSI